MVVRSNQVKWTKSSTSGGTLEGASRRINGSAGFSEKGVRELLKKYLGGNFQSVGCGMGALLTIRRWITFPGLGSSKEPSSDFRRSKVVMDGVYQERVECCPSPSQMVSCQRPVRYRALSMKAPEGSILTGSCGMANVPAGAL